MASFKKIGTENWQVSFYCKDYIGENKKYKKSGFKTKKEANDFVNEFIALKKGTSNITLLTAVEEFIEYKKKFIKIKTLRQYNTAYNHLIDKPISKIGLNDLTKKDFIKFLEGFYQVPSTFNFLLSFLKMVLDYCETHYNFKNKTVLNFKINIKQNSKKEKQIWTIDEFYYFDKIISETKTKKTRAFFNLLYFSGARAGEITGLTLDDIDFNNNTININKTRIKKDLFNSPKTLTSNRIITIPKKIMEILKEYTITLPNVKSDVIFADKSSYGEMLVNLIKEEKIKPMTLHGFRHSHASLLIKKGVPITDICRRLGHSNPQITLSVYSHFYNEKDDEIVKLLENL